MIRDERLIAAIAAQLHVRAVVCGNGDLTSDDERTEDMNVSRYESELRKDADRLHRYAQQTGRAVDYIKAAEIYERAGDYQQAQVCREAAERLEKAQ